MDKKIIYTGTDIFEDLVENNGYYVDKTKIIEELFEKRSKVTLFPRPRRFGKTLTMSMLACFFDINKDSKELFKDLYIESSPYYKEMNKYPVIFLTFKRLKYKNYEDVEKEYIKLVSKLYIEKRYVMEKMIDEEIDLYKKIMNRTADMSDYRSAISDLVEYLYRFHEQKVIVLIDEYDTPINSGYINDYYDEIIDLIKDIFDVFKTNNNLFLGVLTGVLRVSKESLFSDPNNIKVRAMIDSDFGEYFGFTEDDTKEVLEYYGLELTQDAKNMYDGYNFNGVSVYNPWSIMNYAEGGRLNNYWINTSGNELIKIMLSDTSDENKAKIEKLIQGDSIAFTYDDKLTYKNFDNHSDINILLNLFFASGYLTIKDRKTINNIERIYIGIPNNEVKEYLTKVMLESISREGANTTAFANDVLDALVDYDLVKLERTLNNSLDVISYFDSKEAFFHGYMLGVFKNCLDDDNFIVKSNREAGRGRYDVMIETVDKSYGYIFEFKIAKSDEDMEIVAKNALEQIEDKEYYKELESDKIKDIRRVSIVFNNKECIVR